eukprot:CAMPEP_0197288546 /NCGR_PEP_ID=MMETSP0890-20130614/5667_1 /TAXON_ID=44058 ORGANISM="Aureoumbra lagunensis, Strain CCMP1510" /NCGR_SAMPLE_ID=MMETSP0890 /ASSEMBLY_ACC=CAM_ASM_000533 /LENGTH=262 /DNA_ID=CAMNT_0042759353 /DNA_START=81 /DNA_END=869 /DNA_ORIENTATION=-
MLHGYERSKLVSEFYELLEYAQRVEERGATCVRRMFKKNQESLLDWTAFDNGVERYLAANGVYSNFTPALEFSQVNEKNDGGIIKLRGEKGAFAKRRIETGECLGQYIGDEMLLFEFEEYFPWYHGTEDQRKRWYYAMHVGYDRSNIDRTMKRYASRKPDPFIARQKAIPENIMITTVSDPIKPSIALVNDCRENMNQPDPTPTDLERLNAEFVFCDVDSAMFPFLIATKTIETNEQIFAYYGPSFILYDDNDSLHSARSDL